MMSLEAELLTATHSVAGRLATGGRRLRDFLNFEGDELIVLTEARMVSLDHPEEPPISSDFARINKNAVLVALPQETSADLEQKKPRALDYLPKERHRVTVTLPPFMVTEDIHLVKKVDLRSSRMEEMFLAISPALILYLPDPLKTWTSGVALVNREKIEIMWPPLEVWP